MAIVKRDKKTKLYYVRYEAGFDKNGKRIQRRKGGFVRKGDADIFASEVTIRKATGGLSIDPKMTLGAYWEQYMESRTDIKENTRELYDRTLMLIGELKDIPLEKLKPLHISKWLGSLADGYKESSITMYYSKLKTVISDAVKNDLIIKSPCIQIPSPKTKTDNDGHIDKFLSKNEIDLLLSHMADTRFYLPIYLSLSLGLRRGEVLGLQWEDIDLENKEVKIRHNYIKEKGLAKLKDYLKTSHSSRTLELSDKLISVIKAHKLKQTINKLAIGEEYLINDFVCTAKNGRPISPDTFYNKLVKLSKELNIEHLTPHSLRHTSASMMVASNIPLKAISRILGHSDTNMVDRIYAHINTDDRRKFLNILSDEINNVK